MFKNLIVAAALAAVAFFSCPAVGQNYDDHRDDYRGDNYRDDGDYRGDYRGDGRGHGNRSRYGSSLVCESRNNARRYCAVNMRNYDVAVIRQLSNDRCVQGRTWGYDRRGIWVDHGCRAEFGLNSSRSNGYAGNDGRYDRDSMMRCESSGNHREYCRTNGTRSVRLISQISSAPCISGRSWGYNSGSVWVDNGCRGDFQLIR